MNLRKINRWRAQYNPLRALTMQRAVSLLEAGERGDYADLQWTFRAVEKREPTLRALKRLRIGALKRLDWDIKLVDSADPAIAERQAAILRLAYERISNLTEAIAFLALAEFRGFAHLEKRYEKDDPSGPVVRLEPVEQWHWCRDTLYGEWKYNADASSGINQGVPIEGRHFIVRQVEDPINEIAFICYLRKNLSQKDWDGFVEVYGLPPLFIELPQNTPAGKEAEYQEMAEAVIGDMRGTLPNGAKVQTAGDSVRGVNPFRDHLTYQDEQLVLAGTSGKLTMLAAPTGLGSGVSETQQDTFDTLAQAEAMEISEVFQRQFDRAVLDANGFAGQPALAYFQIAAVDQEDVGQILDHAVKARNAGLQVDPAEMAEKTSLKLTLAPVAPAAPAFGGGGPAAFARASTTRNRGSVLDPDQEAIARATRDRAAEALAKRLQPVREAIQLALDAADDTAFDAAVAQARALIERESKSLGLGADDPLAKALYEGLASAAVDGAAEAAQATARHRSGGALDWFLSLFRP